MVRWLIGSLWGAKPLNHPISQPPSQICKKARKVCGKRQNAPTSLQRGLEAVSKLRIYSKGGDESRNTNHAASSNASIAFMSSRLLKGICQMKLSLSPSLRRLTLVSCALLAPLLLITAVLIASQSQASASSHREAPLISKDPYADNTDTYVFLSRRIRTMSSWSAPGFLLKDQKAGLITTSGMTRPAMTSISITTATPRQTLPTRCRAKWK